MNSITQDNFKILKRNKIQRWLLIASGVFLFISLVSFIVSDNSSTSTKQAIEEKVNYSDIPLSQLLEQANLNYEKGNYTQAIPYLEEAANRGNAKAQYSLGYMYEKGEGLQIDTDKAKEYYKLSAKQGHKKAKSALKKFGV